MHALKRRSLQLDEFLFTLGMYWRILYGAFRIVVGYILLRLVGTPLVVVFYKIVGQALTENPRDDGIVHLIAHLLMQHGYHVTYFLAGYLLFWGVVDTVLSISMLKHQLWAFPIALYVIMFFIFYEIYRFTHTHSLILLTIIVIDIGLIFLIQNEQRKLSKRRGRK